MALTLALKPGEGFVICLGGGEVRSYGEVKAVVPMGSLAKLVWMKLEGADWSTRSVVYRCMDSAAGPSACRKGHGRVDLARALRADCDQAFLAWIGESRTRWVEEYGESVARARMEELFEPFLGRRLPPGQGLPPLTAVWVGEGDLLRTSPEAFLQWLLEPDKSEVITFGKRYLSGSWVEVMDLFGKDGWWFKTATAAVVGDPTATSAWVVGGRGSTLVVLHLPRGRGSQEGMTRIREILGLKP